MAASYPRNAWSGLLLAFLMLSPKPATADRTDLHESSSLSMQGLNEWLAQERSARRPLEEQGFAAAPLTRADALTAFERLWDDYADGVREALQNEWENKVIDIGRLSMKFDYRILGRKPKDGRDLYLSFHGGGGTTAAVNDAQWKNQITLYTPDQGIYVAPRAPTDAWNLWHQAHIDAFLARLIQGAIIHMDVNPDRVYIMGYSAGGDGVYQLAPRISDRLAAAAMMAGHPNETSPKGLRNLPFTIHVGRNDSGYRRNEVARSWKEQLADLQDGDPGGYVHEVHLHRGMGHWMNGKDAVALEWMAQFSRNPFPDKVVWKQDDVTHSQFYWLEVPEEERKARSEIVAERKGQAITLSGISGLGKVTVLLNDHMLDLDRPVTIRWQDKVLFSGMAQRTLATLSRTLENRSDPKLFFSAAVTVELDRSGR
jgi:hypothetical protein